MPNWVIVDKVAFVNGMVTVNVNIDMSDFPLRLQYAQQRLGEMVLASSKVFMPLLTGSLQQRSYVADGGKKVVFPGPYGRYQYGGRIMVDSVTGKGPALIHDKNGIEVGLRFRKGATLVPTTRRLTYSQPNAQAEWFEPAKSKDLQAWIAECDRIIKGGRIMAAVKPIDVNGSEIISTVLIKLLNEFPGLNGKIIKFHTLEDKSGLGFFPVSGAAIISSKESITGHVSMQCAYPFNVIYRAAAKTENQKLTIKEFLDTLGKWLERQPIVVNGEQVQLHDYPELDKGRIITSINRNSPGHLNAAYEDGVEDWLISVVLRYKYEFDTA